MTDDLLAAEAALDELRVAVRLVLRSLDAGDRDDLRRGDSPQHHHGRPGVWSADSKPAVAGRPCETCAAWQRLWRLVGSGL